MQTYSTPNLSPYQPRVNPAILMRAIPSIPARTRTPKQMSNADFISWARVQATERATRGAQEAEKNYNLLLLDGRDGTDINAYALMKKDGTRICLSPKRDRDGVTYYRAVGFLAPDGYGDQLVLDVWNARLARLGASFRIEPKRVAVRQTLFALLWKGSVTA